MDRASSLIYPGSRTLVSWWRQLAPYQPQAFWIGYCFLHRVEAPVRTLATRSVDPFAHLILQALALEQSSGPNHGTGVNIANLETRLRMPAAVVQRLLLGMQETGWLARVGHDHWLTTEPGRQALEHRVHVVPTPERRVLPFVERMDAAGQRVDAPHFLPIAECVHVPWHVDEAHRFERRLLQTSIEQAADWKAAFAFPGEIQTLIADTPADDGQHVILDRPERVLLASIIVGKELHCFAAKVDGWALYERNPVVRLPASAREPWPETARDPSAEVWKETWRSWCRQRQMPAAEVDACTLTYHAPRLEIQAPPRLVQRLQAAKSDLFKNEAWVLVGDGYLRTAALLSLRMA